MIVTIDIEGFHQNLHETSDPNSRVTSVLTHLSGVFFSVRLKGYPFRFIRVETRYAAREIIYQHHYNSGRSE